MSLLSIPADFKFSFQALKEQVEILTLAFSRHEALGKSRSSELNFHVFETRLACTVANKSPFYHAVRALTPDWSVNSFIMVIYEKNFKISIRIFYSMYD